MDQSALVSGGQALVRALDQANYAPRFAMWVHNDEVGTWKLWIVPPKGEENPREFYHKLVSVMRSCGNQLNGIEAEQAEMVKEDHVAIKALSRTCKVKDLSDVHMKGNVFNGFYLPEGILLRSDV